jgi:hypothetical protein
VRLCLSSNPLIPLETFCHRALGHLNNPIEKRCPGCRTNPVQVNKSVLRVVLDLYTVNSFFVWRVTNAFHIFSRFMAQYSAKAMQPTTEASLAR